MNKIKYIETNKSYQKQLEKIELFIKENFISQTALAIECNISKQRLSSVLKKNRKISESSILKLKNSTNVNYRKLGKLFSDLNDLRILLFEEHSKNKKQK